LPRAKKKDSGPPPKGGREALDELLDAFLEARRESKGGWAPVVDGDVSDLYGIVREIVELKWGPDEDGDRPIDVHLIDRTRFEPSHFLRVPYDLDRGRNPRLKLEAVLANLQTAAEALDRELRKARRRDEHPEEEEAERPDGPGVPPEVSSLLDAIEGAVSGERAIVSPHPADGGAFTSLFAAQAEAALRSLDRGVPLGAPAACGCGNLWLGSRREEASGASPGGVRVVCRKCGAEGPPGPTKYEARRAWNRAREGNPGG